MWSTYATDLGLDTEVGDDEPDTMSGQEDRDRAMPPGAWFFPVAGLIARDDDRGHPDWVLATLGANTLDETAARRCARAAAAIGLTGRPDPWSAYTRDQYAGHSDRELAEVLTPTAAALLARAAVELVDDGVQDVMRFGDGPYPREDALYEGLLGMLPEVCDRQDSAWRLGMIRAILDLRDDLTAGRAPLPRCHSEEIALHLILLRAEENLDLIDDPVNGADYATLNSLPAPAELSARHRDFTMMREVFLQDEDVLMLYDLDLADVATDPEHPAALALHLDDMSPSGWWWTFGNLQPRPAGRGVPAWIINALAAHPASQPGVPQPGDTQLAEEHVLDPAAVLFERMVGLAQRRFFDRACAVAMATGFADLLTAIIDTPQPSVHRAWVHRRATHADTMLIVDEDFTIDRHTTTWRFRSDLSDAQARAWTLDALDDCATKVIDLYRRAAPELLLRYTRTPPPEVDPALAGRVVQRLRALGAQTTTAMLLRHLRHTLGLTLAQVAEPALLPAAVIAGWERGLPPHPAQIIGLAPVMQMPADVLLAAVDGRRVPNTGRFPVPPPQRKLPGLGVLAVLDEVPRATSGRRQGCSLDLLACAGTSVSVYVVKCKAAPVRRSAPHFVCRHGIDSLYLAQAGRHTDQLSAARWRVLAVFGANVMAAELRCRRTRAGRAAGTATGLCGGGRGVSRRRLRAARTASTVGRRRSPARLPPLAQLPSVRLLTHGTDRRAAERSPRREQAGAVA